MPNDDDDSFDAPASLGELISLPNVHHLRLGDAMHAPVSVLDNIEHKYDS